MYLRKEGGSRSKRDPSAEKDELEHTYLFEEGTETKVTYGEKTVTLNRLKAAKRDGVGNKTR